MTGFGRAKQSLSGFEITVEIKSVNHKFFEFSSRLPRAYQFLEEKLKHLCQERIARGKVEISAMIENTAGNNIELTINRDYADAYIAALKSLAKEYKLKDDVKLSTLAHNPDIFIQRKAQHIHYRIGLI